MAVRRTAGITVTAAGAGRRRFMNGTSSPVDHFRARVTVRRRGGVRVQYKGRWGAVGPPLIKRGGVDPHLNSGVAKVTDLWPGTKRRAAAQILPPEIDPECHFGGFLGENLPKLPRDSVVKCHREKIVLLGIPGLVWTPSANGGPCGQAGGRVPRPHYLPTAPSFYRTLCWVPRWVPHWPPPARSPAAGRWCPSAASPARR